MLFVWRLSQTLYLLVDICFKYWRFSSRDDEYCNAWELSGFGNHKLLIVFQWSQISGDRPSLAWVKPDTVKGLDTRRSDIPDIP